MTEYADKDICERLWKLSEWTATDKYWVNGVCRTLSHLPTNPDAEIFPAYTLAFILDKLPDGCQVSKQFGGTYSANTFETYDDSPDASAEAATPTNAAALLACELIEQGILKRAAQNGEGE